MKKNKVSYLITLVMIIIFLIFSPLVFTFEYSGIHWSKNSVTLDHDWRSIPIIDETSYRSSYADGFLEDATTQWNLAGSSFQFNAIAFEPNISGCGDGNTSSVLVTSAVRDGQVLWVSNIFDAGETTVKFDEDNKIISPIFTRMNKNLDWSLIGDPNKYDLLTCLLHELGHWLMLDDCPEDNGNIMYAYYPGEQRSLSQDDIDGIQHIYPPGMNLISTKITRTISKLKSRFISSSENITYLKTINNYIDDDLYLNQNGILNFYYEHDFEVQQIFKNNPELYNDIKNIFKKIDLKQVANHLEVTDQPKNNSFVLTEEIANDIIKLNETALR